MIYIPGDVQDFDKPNHAYAYGGAKLAIQHKEVSHMNGYISESGNKITSAWLHHLNGAEAMGDMRIVIMSEWNVKQM